jgi:hypothetical protein
MYHTGHQSRARLTPFRLSTRSYIHLPETKTSTITPRIGRLTSSQNGVRQFSLTSKHTTFQNYRFLLRVIPDADHADQLICELDAMAWVAEGQVHTMSFTLWQLRMSSLMKEPSPIIHGDVSDGYRQDEEERCRYIRSTWVDTGTDDGGTLGTRPVSSRTDILSHIHHRLSRDSK